MAEDLLKIADRTFCSRLFVGTGKFSSPQILEKTLIASQTQMVTMALRRVDLNNPDDHILTSITNFQLLPNTSGARNAQEAVRLARMARASGLTNWIKLEVTPEPRYLLPDGEQTVLAAQQLVEEGFVVLPYIQADPIIAKRLAEIGTAAVMPLAAPIGSNKGIKNAEMLAIILEQADVPVIVDAGLGRPSDAALAMEMGAAAVLVNTAIATADNPVLMAQAFAQAVQAGRKAYLAAAGNYNSATAASASSPLAWISDLDV